MRRCLHLGGLASGWVSPNPMVGGVIVHENKVIGEGYHERYGAAHAEVNAIQSVKEPSLLPYSTLYVSLEPCAHFGKTPPCADLIIASKIPRVIIGMQDPFNEVNGRGVEKLRAAGVEVTTGILENECEALNKRFLSLHRQHRPYITLKWAMTADGFAGRPDRRIQISNEATAIHAHQLRHSEQAIMVGAGTIITDNPRLNIRHLNGNHPIRIIIDPKGKINPDDNFHIFDGTQRTLLFTSNVQPQFPNIEVYEISNDKISPIGLAAQLAQLKIDSVLIEGGPSLQKSFLAAALWDECYIYQSQQLLATGIAAPPLPSGLMNNSPIGNNQLIHIRKA